MAGAQLTVLIVEARPLDGMDLEEAVVLAGHQVIGWATTVQNAIALVEARPPDLAFVNLQLRDGNTGIDLSRRLAARGIAVVVTTANSDEVSNLDHILGLVPKPFSMEAVQQVLQYAQNREGREAVLNDKQQ
jgi:AmiR/NasT family two-component response regulator